MRGLSRAVSYLNGRMVSRFYRMVITGSIAILVYTGILAGSEEPIISNFSFEEGEIHRHADGRMITSKWEWIIRVQPDTGNPEDIESVMDNEFAFDGEKSLKVTMTREGVICWIEQTRRPLAGGKTYNFSFAYRSIPEDAADIRVRFIWWGKDFEDLGPGKQVQWLIVREKKDMEKGWKLVNIPLDVPEGVHFFSLNIVVRKCRSFWLDKVTLQENSDFKKGIILNSRKYFYKPRAPEEPMLNFTETEKKKGYVSYLRKNPRELFYTSVPRREEITDKISIFATPGEYEPAWIAVYALKPLQGVRVKVTDFVSETGEKIVKENINIRIVHDWPQGSTGTVEYVDNTYSIFPEMILEKEKVDILEKESRNFYFLVKIPEETVPGRYSGKILINPENAAPSEVMLNVRVLPFRLETPPVDKMVWVMHTTGNFEGIQSSGMTIVDAATAALIDMKERGIEGISLGCGYGPPARFKVEDGKLKLVAFPKVEYTVLAMKNARMKGPLIIHCGDMLEYQVAEALDVERPGRGQVLGVSEAMNTDAFKNAFKEALREIDRFVKKLGGENFKWYYEGVDEPGSHKGRQKRALWQWRMAKEAGFESAVFMSGTFWKELAPYNRIQIFGAQQLCLNKEVNRKLLKEIESLGNIPFHYGYTGTYGDLPGGLMPNRWGAGFLSWIAGVRGCVSWLYSMDKVIDPYGLDQLRFYPLVAYATSGNVLTPTLQFEGIREGIDDYRYIYTLNNLIERSKKSARTRKIAARIETELKELLEIVPWGEDYESVTKTFTNDTANLLRWQIAMWIMELKKGQKE